MSLLPRESETHGTMPVQKTHSERQSLSLGVHTGGRHDGRGAKFLSVLFRSKGSIILRTLPISMASASLSILLMAVKTFELVPEPMLPILRHPIAVQMLAIVLGYVIVLRVNVAVGRYFDGITNVQFFGSKWSDAYTQLSAFIRSSAIVHRTKLKDNPAALDAKMKNLALLQRQLLHWFSMLHALAINALQVCQMEQEEKVIFARLRTMPTPNLMHLASLEAVPEPPQPLPPMLQEDALPPKNAGLEAHCLPIVGDLTKEERKWLARTEAKVDLVHSWIIEMVACGSLEGHIITAPPILSRVYQELSNGMLGFNQAYKVALVQFPFAFAQMLTLFLVAFLFCCPLVVFVFTGGEVLTPALTFFTVLGFWGIHEIAVEIENPYGTEVNHLPLVSLHTAVIDALIEVTVAKAPLPNIDDYENKEE